jgi:uncharacterized sulfatase
MASGCCQPSLLPDEPLYPHTVEVPVAIDKTLVEHFEAGDEYIYWPN